MGIESKVKGKVLEPGTWNNCSKTELSVFLIV